MSLSGQQRKKLQEALIEAFPTKSLLEQMLLFELDKNLDAIAGKGSLKEIVFNLIKIANSQGWVKELIDGACKENPGNSDLKAIALELQSSKTSSVSEQSPNISTTASKPASSKRLSEGICLRRICAYLIDLILLCNLISILLKNVLKLDFPGDTRTIIISLPIIWLYFALFESFPQKATIGKKILEIYVCHSRTGDKISFWHATWRILVKICFTYLCMTGGLGLFIDFLYKKYTKKSLYDKLTRTKTVIEPNNH